MENEPTPLEQELKTSLQQVKYLIENKLNKINPIDCVFDFIINQH